VSSVFDEMLAKFKGEKAKKKMGDPLGSPITSKRRKIGGGVKAPKKPKSAKKPKTAKSGTWIIWGCGSSLGKLANVGGHADHSDVAQVAGSAHKAGVTDSRGYVKDGCWVTTASKSEISESQLDADGSVKGYATAKAAKTRAKKPKAAKAAKPKTAKHPAVYASTYCNKGHSMKTGRPIKHECRVIPPAALRAERDGDFATAIAIMQGRK